VAMHVAVGEQADQMEDAAPGAFAIFGGGDDLAPGRPGPDRAGGDGVGHQRRSLRIDLAGADGVVADLGIAHVVVGRHADRLAMRAQPHVRIIGEQPVERRLARRRDRAADVVLRQADAVQDDRDDGAGDAGKRREFGQHNPFRRNELARTNFRILQRKTKTGRRDCPAGRFLLKSKT